MRNYLLVIVILFFTAGCAGCQYHNYYEVPESDVERQYKSFELAPPSEKYEPQTDTPARKINPGQIR